MNEWALITGASSGIGSELARVFAEHRFHLVLTARDTERLNALAAELRARHAIDARVIPCDLARTGAAQAIFDQARDLPISVLVNNAGLGFHGAFAESALADQATIMQVNMTALVELTHLFLQPMLARKHGRILNVASTAAFQPGPLINVYYASKAFVFSFTYALADELKESSIAVSVLCPGTTQTEFFARGRFGRVRTPFAMHPRDVAKAGYAGLMRGKRVIIPGWKNRLASVFAKRLPVCWTTAAVRKLHAK